MQKTVKRRGIAKVLKNWRAYFDSPQRGSLPERHQPPLDERDGIRG